MDAKNRPREGRNHLICRAEYYRVKDQLHVAIAESRCRDRNRFRSNLGTQKRGNRDDNPEYSLAYEICQTAPMILLIAFSSPRDIR